MKQAQLHALLEGYAKRAASEYNDETVFSEKLLQDFIRVNNNLLFTHFITPDDELKLPHIFEIFKLLLAKLGRN